jgi:hypothetical protein
MQLVNHIHENICNNLSRIWMRQGKKVAILGEFVYDYQYAIRIARVR